MEKHEERSGQIFTNEAIERILLFDFEASLSCCSFFEDGRICLRHQDNGWDSDRTRHDKDEPCCPSPAQMTLCYEASHKWSHRWTCIDGRRVQRSRHTTFRWGPEICEDGADNCHRCSTTTSSQKTTYQNSRQSRTQSYWYLHECKH